MGMTIDEAIRRIDEHNYIHQSKEPRAVYITEAFDTLVGVVMKYQKIQEIVKSWREVGLDYDSCDAMENIERAIDGKAYIYIKR